MTMDWKTLIAVIIICYTAIDIAGSWVSHKEKLAARKEVQEQKR